MYILHREKVLFFPLNLVSAEMGGAERGMEVQKAEDERTGVEIAQINLTQHV